MYISAPIFQVFKAKMTRDLFFLQYQLRLENRRVTEPNESGSMTSHLDGGYNTNPTPNLNLNDFCKQMFHKTTLGSGQRNHEGRIHSNR